MIAAPERLDVRHRPLAVRFDRTLPALVSIPELTALLRLLQPSWEVFRLPAAIHALRLWGQDAVFNPDTTPRRPGARTFTGRELLALFLDHRQYRRMVMASTPILDATDDGVVVAYRRKNQGFEGEIAHVDKLLRVCGELGIPSNLWIRTDAGESTLREIVRGAVATFDPGQELEWTLEAFARYLTPTPGWSNRFGTAFGFEAGVEVLLERGFGNGSCMGTHVPYCLVMLLVMNREADFLTRATAKRASEHLRTVATKLERTQRDDGSWPIRWTDGIDLHFEPGSVDEMSTLLLIAGHHLEWLAYAPAELRPKSDCMARALRFAMTNVSRLPPRIIEDHYHVLSHIGRACCAYAGVDHIQAYQLLL